MGDINTVHVKEASLKLKTASIDELPDLINRYSEDPRSGIRIAVDQAKRRLAAYEAEYQRSLALYQNMWDIAARGCVLGIDEVGRGAVAGPLTVACVQLPDDPIIVGLNDSKQLSPAARNELARTIKSKALAIGIAHIPPEEIDEIGMARALRKAMLLSIENSGADPDAVLIDGNEMHIHPKEKCVVKGDSKIACIAAASIVAKVCRDEIMVLADKDFPGYGFASSKGYASAEHIEAIQAHGLTEFHRASFCSNFFHEQLNLF